MNYYSRQVNKANTAKTAYISTVLGILALFFAFPPSVLAGDEPFHAGFLFDRFDLTLDQGGRTEIFGPLYYRQMKDDELTWAIPPLTLAHVENLSLDYEEWDFIYPFLTYDRYGGEYRWQFFQLLSFAGGRNQNDTNTSRFTLYPVYFQQRSKDTNDNYTAFVPFYGTLKHRLFKDEIEFVMFPIYAKTRKKDVITYNMPYPFYHVRYGDHLHGWQLFPFYGHERKDSFTRTNADLELQTVPGHDSSFILWPFYSQLTNGIGTANLSTEKAFIPFYDILRSPQVDRTCYGWPLGVTHTVNHEKNYVEWDTPWPLIEFAHGEGKTENRVWPFFSQARGQHLEADWYLWPIYKFNRYETESFSRERTRVALFLYNSVNVTNSESGKFSHRRDFFPFYTYQREMNGNQRLQVMSLFECFFPDNHSVVRDYSQLYSLWRSEKNAKTGAASQSLLWNLYRRETSPGAKYISLLFGVFQYQSGSNGAGWRMFHWSSAKNRAGAAASTSK